MTSVFTVQLLLVISVRWACGQSDYESHKNKDDSIIPPYPKGKRYPCLLHENDVIHHLDSEKQFKRVGHGAYADVYLGELKDTGQPVVIKSFRDSDFEEIMDEVRIHRYVERIVQTPKLVGLLPAGALSANVSIIYDFIPNAKNLAQWLDKKVSFTQAQWIHVCLEIAKSLQFLHKNDVLYNDLHEGNILIQNSPFASYHVHPHCETSKPVTYILDFGAATYKRGKFFSSSYESLKSYQFLAPELIKDNPSTSKENGRKLSKEDGFKSIKRGKSNRRADTARLTVTNVSKKHTRNHLYDKKYSDGFNSAFGNKDSHPASSDGTKAFNKSADQGYNNSNHNQASPTRAPTSPASDIFSLGLLLKAIADHSNLPQLLRLSLWCKASDPQNRPQIYRVIRELQDILVELKLVQLSSCGPKHVNKDALINIAKSGDSPFSPFFRPDDNTIRNFSTPFSSRCLCGSTCQYKKTRYNGFAKTYKGCAVPMALVDNKDVLEDFELPFEGQNWIRYSSSDALKLALLNSSGQIVIVKLFYDSDFETIRHEACMTEFLARLSIAPPVIGIFIDSEYMNGSAFVQERFGEGVTLAQFIKDTRNIESDRDAIRKSVVGFNNKKNNDDMVGICLLFDYLMTLLKTKTKALICAKKSYRKVILEGILRKTAEKLDVIHRSGFLLNNLHAGNILLGLKGGAIDVKLIDLGKVTPLDNLLDLEVSGEEISSFSYLAPELGQGGVFNTFTDIYSLCILIEETLHPYFVKYSADPSFTEIYKTRSVRHTHFSSVERCLSPCKCDNNTVSFESSSIKSDSKCCLQKCYQIWEREMYKDISASTKPKVNAEFCDENEFDRLAKLQVQLFRCFHDKPLNRPSIDELLQNL